MSAEPIKVRVHEGILPKLVEGLSPEVDLVQTAQGVEMTVTTKSGVKTAIIPKGQDYWLTDEDKADIEQEAFDTFKDAAEAEVEKAEGWAEGTQDGTPVESGSPYYEHNAKYWAGEAADSAEDAADSATAAQEAAATASAAYGTDLLAPDFSTSSTYAVGDYVIHSGDLYRCTTAVTTAGEWNNSSWTQVEVGGEVGALKSAISTRNIVDILAFQKGYVKSSDGTITSSNSNYYSAMFPVLPGEMYHLVGNVSTALMMVAYYKTSDQSTAENSSIPGANRDEYVFIPDDVCFARICYDGTHGIIKFIRCSESIARDATESIRNIKRALTLDQEEHVYTLDYIDGETTLPLISGLSSSGLSVARRMTTDFIPIPGDFEVFCDKDEKIVSFNIALYDSTYTIIQDVSTNVNTRIKKVWVNTADFPTAKYMKVSVCDWSNASTDLTSAQNEYAKRHIIFRPYIKVKNTPDSKDFQQGRSEIDHVLVVDYTTRATTNVFYANTDDVYPISNYRDDLVEFYLKYYNADFQFVEDGSWNTLSLRTKEYNYPYFKIAIRRADDHSADISTSLAQTLGGYIHFRNQLALGYTYNSSGEKVSTSRIRACEENKTYIKDGYIKIKHHDYNYDICVFDTESGAVSAEYGWFNYAGNYGRTDKAIRIQNKYVALIFAKYDRTSTFTDEEWATLNSLYKAGSLYEIIESIDPRSIGEEIKNGYPDFYNAEAKATVNSIASKTGYAPVKFAMITDLHDNDPTHLSETVKKQVMAIRDLHRKIGLDFVICGGDLTDGGYGNKSVLLDKMTEQVKMFKEVGVPVLMMRGNHDDNSYAGLAVTKVVSKEEFNARCIAPFSGKVIPNGKNYYYQDFDEVNARVICLDYIDYPWEVSEGNVVYHAVGGDGVWRGYSDDQIDWLLGTALNCGKRIIITGHYSTHPNLMTTWEKDTNHNYTVVNQAMIAYNSGGSVTFGGHTYSFANKTGKVLVQVSGHSHSFGAFKDNGIVWSTTGSPSPEVTDRTHADTDYETMGTRTYGDITEAHFNAFVCDNSNVHIISFGQMGDLDFEI